MIYNILQFLEQSAYRFPDKVALEDECEKITYREYEEKAKKIGSYLIEKLNGKVNQPIAVLIDRNVSSIIAFMGVVYSGNFYVPIDATMPEERIKLIYDTLKPIMILDARRGKEEKDIDNVLDILNERNLSMNDRLDVIRDQMIDMDPLYAIFTSGSTGVPKGVVVSHKSVIDLVEAFDEAFTFNESQIFGNQAPFDFDVSVKDIYNALKVGATVSILPKKLFKMPKLLIDYLKEKKINTLIWAVSALRIVSDFKALDEIEAPIIKYIMFSGEVMPIKALNYWMDYLPTTQYVNLYGPTEITCNCTYYKVEKRHAADEMLPIGKAFKNSRVFLRSETGAIINEKQQVGEICVTGSCLALGYWNDLERTEAVFIQNPMIKAYKSRIYATGDMGYYDEKGNLIFASRKDFQIKHMGHRIELGEIEASLNALPFLRVACCLYDEKNNKIVCFYESEEECKKRIVQALAQKLPKYMWPNVYMHYQNLPMNKNGKIDRVLLATRLKENN